MSDPLNYQPSHSAAYYVHPGQFNLKRLAISFLVVAVAIGLAAIAYAKIEPNIPQTHVRSFAAVAIALVIGILCMMPIQTGRVRSPAIAAIAGAVLSMFGLYVMWVVWVHDVVNQLGYPAHYDKLIANPARLWRLIKVINGLGLWRVGGDIIRGTQLYIWWFGEGAMIVAAGTIFPTLKLFSGDPVCRECGTLCKRLPHLPNFAGDEQAAAAAAIDNRSFEELMTLAPPESDDAPEVRIRLAACPRCKKTNVLTLNRIAWMSRGTGRFLKTTAVINELLITPEEAAALIEVAVRIREQRAAQ